MMVKVWLVFRRYVGNQLLLLSMLICINILIEVMVSCYGI